MAGPCGISLHLQQSSVISARQQFQPSKIRQWMILQLMWVNCCCNDVNVPTVESIKFFFSSVAVRCFYHVDKFNFGRMTLCWSVKVKLQLFHPKSIFPKVPKGSTHQLRATEPRQCHREQTDCRSMEELVTAAEQRGRQTRLLLPPCDGAATVSTDMPIAHTSHFLFLWWHAGIYKVPPGRPEGNEPLIPRTVKDQTC